MHSWSWSYIHFSKNFDTKGEILIGLYLALSLGSSFLYTDVMSESLKVSDNFLLVKASLIHFESL